MILLIILLIIVPLLEIYLFLEVGSILGIGPTLLIILLTAVLGAYFVRQQGVSLLFKARQKMDENKLPADEIFSGLCVLSAGLLLLTPGFFTDTIGFLLLVPAVRAFLKEVLMDAVLGGFTYGFVDTDTVRWAKGKYDDKYKKDDTVIEAEFEDITDQPPLEADKK
jgi:UPF0716 protein FxsA